VSLYLYHSCGPVRELAPKLLACIGTRKEGNACRKAERQGRIDFYQTEVGYE